MKATNSIRFVKASNVFHVSSSFLKLESFQCEYKLSLVLPMVSASVRSFFIRCMSVWMLVVQVESQTKSKLEVMYKRLNRQLVKKGGNQKKVSSIHDVCGYMMIILLNSYMMFFFWLHTSCM